jgi:circadian clock protein KaiC
VTTGITGLDEILEGGFVANRTYLLTGPPGGGKTTLGWHFLTAGSAAGEPVLFLTFGEPRTDLVQNARSSGFTIENVAFCDLSPNAELFSDLRSYDIFPASEVELEPTTHAIMSAVRTVRPTRVFVDSMTALRYLAKDDADFRRQTLAFLRFLKEQGCTVLLTSEASADTPDDDLRFLADGVIEVKPNERTRSVTVLKFRGSDYRAGAHTLVLDERGATVYPRLRPNRQHGNFHPEPLSWGVAELDALSHGGLERGTVTLLSGPSGVGKSTVGTVFVKEAARRGERSAIYSFDERAETLIARSESVNLPLRTMIAAGTLRVESIEALRYSADEFANLVRRDVEENGTRVVMIDSISGYRLSVSNDNIHERLHELCRYLQNMGVTVLLVNELVEIADFKLSEAGITYLADNVLVLRYLELRGDDRPVMGRALGVLKKRLSDFEKSMHVFRFTKHGIAIGDEPVSIGPLLGGASVLVAPVAV